MILLRRSALVSRRVKLASLQVAGSFAQVDCHFAPGMDGDPKRVYRLLRQLRYPGLRPAPLTVAWKGVCRSPGALAYDF
jgi:hypothetical protein